MKSHHSKNLTRIRQASGFLRRVDVRGMSENCKVRLELIQISMTELRIQILRTK